MNSDCAFAIGKTHRVCQDYAVAGSENEGERTYVLLADGCSSSADSDIGARLLVKAAQRRLPGPSATHTDWDYYHDNAIHQAAVCAESLDLRPDCLDATLLTITAEEDGAFTACCYGDGVVALGRQDGRLEVYAISYAASYPNYPSYRWDAARRGQWEAQPDNEKQVTRWTLGTDGMTEEMTCLSRRASELLRGTADEYQFAAVLSDGIQSFTETCETDTSRTPRPVSLTEILPSLLAFKGSQGQFVQRRVTAFFKECCAHRRQHSDDFSLGVVWLE